MELSASKPWYRVPFVWMLIAIPMSAVVGGIITIILAVKTDDGLVKDDYYTYGKQINRVLARDHAATAIGLHSAIRFDIEANTATVNLTSRHNAALPEHVNMELLHATRAGYDRILTLQRTPAGNYFGLLPELAEGHWLVQLSTDEWRLSGDLYLPGDTEVIIDSGI
ncbi:MAG: FixH family protein [Granulosicoccaceae bacterium]